MSLPLFITRANPCRWTRHPAIGIRAQLESSNLLVRSPAQYHASAPLASIRKVSTLPGNPYIYIFPHPSAQSPATSLATFLPTSPPSASLAVGTTSAVPPSPDVFEGNPEFLRILQDVLKTHASSDPRVQAQAQAFASTSGSPLGLSGVSSPPAVTRPRSFVSPKTMENGAGGTSGPGGAGGGGVGGWVHVEDDRNPPDFGRIPDPEDILGSLEVDKDGTFTDGHGHYQACGSYRLITRHGLLQLSPFLREKLVERLRQEEQSRSGSGVETK